ncbi:MAG: hypothetical protein QOE92_674 [Chloroflexota bacterium]|jgi:hypothetical protein|nr:hypothetical protein [Chloroflexota bacterium]
MRPWVWVAIAGLSLVGIACIAFIAVLAFALWRGQPGDCVAARAGADVTLEISGFAADAACGEFVQSSGGTWYRAPNPETARERGTVACQIEQRGQTYTVRDTGFQLIGTELCQELSRRAGR